ncbi:MAG TPA: FAD-binding oxidoreductase, partial [Casimicrobiaceae bacterium]|nr:FAD-binding oxidoreductase [Casimicrobiaceae bacterium]
MLDPSFTTALAAIVPPPALLTAAEDTRPYECDGLTLYREQPAAVVLPDNEAQV